MKFSHDTSYDNIKSNDLQERNSLKFVQVKFKIEVT